MQQDKTFYLGTLLSIVLFLMSGFASTYLFYRYPDDGGALLPGLLFTSSTILIFVLTKVNFTIRKLMAYYLLMNITYILMYIITFISSWFGAFTGIITAGAGAILSFILTDKYIVKISFNKTNLFLLGGLAFLLTDLLYLFFNLSEDKLPFEYFFLLDGSVKTVFTEVFIFWHTIVGTKLFLTLHKNNLQHITESGNTGS